MSLFDDAGLCSSRTQYTFTALPTHRGGWVQTNTRIIRYVVMSAVVDYCHIIGRLRFTLLMYTQILSVYSHKQDFSFRHSFPHILSLSLSHVAKVMNDNPTFHWYNYFNS